jgi:toxin ParE1/3/4
VASIRYADEVTDDFDRILDHLVQHESVDALDRFSGIRTAIDVLATSPLIGRPAAGEFRELVIGRGGRGYVALYRYSEAMDRITVVAIRAQKESGYHRP